MATRRVIPSRVPLTITAALLVVVLGSLLSCRKYPTQPIESTSSSPFLGDPGTQVTATNDAGLITWLTTGTDIAFESLSHYGPAILGPLKMVNINSMSAVVLDGTVQSVGTMDAEGDSLFYNGGSEPAGSAFFVVVPGATNPKPSIVSGPGGVISPDCKLAASVDVTGDSLQLTHIPDRIVQAFPILPGELPVRFSPDSRRLLISTGRILDVADGSLTTVPFPLPDIRSLTWTADGIWALTVSQNPTSSPMTLDVYTVTNLMTGQSREIWRSAATDMMGFEFAMSKDGKRVAFLRCTPMNIVPTVHYLYVCDIPGGTTTQLLSVAVRLGVGAIPGIDSFSFSPDGKRIAYAVEGNIYYSDL